MKPTIAHVMETCLYGPDLGAMERFYTDVLGLERMTAEYPRHVFFRVSARNVLLVFNPSESIKKADVPHHGSQGPGHVAFAISREDLDEWREELGRHDIDIEKEITWGNGARSIYMRDPAGNSVELVTRDIWRPGGP